MKGSSTFARRRARGQDVVDDPDLTPSEREALGAAPRSDHSAHIPVPVYHEPIALGAGRADLSQDGRVLPTTTRCHLMRQEPHEPLPALDVAGRVYGDWDQQRSLKLQTLKRLGQVSSEAQPEGLMPAVLGGEDVLTRCRLPPIIPARQGPRKGRRLSAARGTQRALRDRIGQALGAAQTARPFARRWERVSRATRSYRDCLGTEQTARRPQVLGKLKEEPHARETRPRSKGHAALASGDAFVDVIIEVFGLSEATRTTAR